MSQFYLVAPSGYCINQQAAARGVERLQQAGHEVAHQQVIPAGSSVSPGLNMNGWPILTSWPSCPAATGSSSPCAAATAPVACCRISTGRDWLPASSATRC
ncbi:muramoyltetrapeptide carboxypeptidase [Klebsiella pneumoniae]|nr:muramoyltetrapeptide carboxypeptidase [Klebsiella pneumoniae]